MLWHTSAKPHRLMPCGRVSTIVGLSYRELNPGRWWRG
jgi:hypothetical protein